MDRARCSSTSLIPLLDLAIGADPTNPPDDVVAWLEQDRVLPLGHLRVPAAAVRRARRRLLADHRPRRARRRRQARHRVHARHAQRHRDQHRARTRPQEGARRAVAGQDRARPDRLRALLHRAQPRPPRPRRDAGGPGVVAGSASRSGRSCRAPSPARCATAGRSSATGCAAWASACSRLRNDVLNAWAMTVVLWAALLVAFGVGIAALPADPGGVRLLPARGGQLPRALRAGAAADSTTAGGSGSVAAAQLEQQQRHDEPVPLPPAAAQRSPREPDPALPGAAALRGVAAAAQRLRHDDRAVLRPAAVAPRDGQAGARALRRRRDARQHPPAQARGARARSPADR